MADNIGLSLDSLGIEAPYSMQAEQSVLGAALLDPACVDVIIQRLKPEMFHVRQNRSVCTEMFTLAANSQPIDIVVLSDRLAADSAFPSVAEAKGYLAELVDTVPSISNLTHYINIVYEKHVKRQLMEQAREILEQAGDDIESQVMLESAEQRLYEIRSGRDTSEVQQLKYAVLDIMAHLQNLAGPNREDYLGVPTGYGTLDRSLGGGLGKSDLIILAARPGMGKTSFALNIATNVAKKGVPIVFFSLEMTKDQLAARILSAEAMVDSNIFRQGVQDPEDWEALTTMSEEVGPLPIFLDDTSAITVPEMKSKVRRLNREATARGKKPIGLVVIDYLQLMSSGRRSENRVQEISEMTRNLKIMAKDLHVPVVVLSQLSRGPEKGRGDHMPMLSDLRDSGSIEQDADVVMFLYREAYYDDGPEVDTNSAVLKVAKNRHGAAPNIELAWDGAHTKYVEIDMVHG